MARTRSRKRVATIVIGSVAVLLAAAIIVPCVFRGRITDGGPAGAGTVRMLETAEITYSSTYPSLGYAPDLATLGPDLPASSTDNCHDTPAHACLIDPKVGCSDGTGLGWCTDGVYRYNIQTSSSASPYKDYWITAAPLKADPEKKNYCAASDAVLRSQSGPPLSRPYTLKECLALSIDPSSYRPN